MAPVRIQEENMSYWHQDANGKWHFDWSHLVALTPFVAFGFIVLVKLLTGTAFR